MKKLITIPDEIVNSLKKMAVDENKSFNKLIEDKLVQISEEYDNLSKHYTENAKSIHQHIIELRRISFLK